MIRHEHIQRIRYSETDQMGYVYYGNYAAFFEIGRAELVRSIGVPYVELEESHGIMMPVVELHVRYRSPARYDDEIRIITLLPHKPTLRLHFQHEIYGPKHNLVVTGEVVLVFVSKLTAKPVRPPQHFLDAVNHFWQP